MIMENIQNEIVNLIKLHQEGGYWDFKKEWYNNKADLLHDIICMANNLSNKDAYIIIGINEEDNYNVVNVSFDRNRRSTQNIVDFLKDKKFAGGTRPTVYVETIKINNNFIDVIVVKNTYCTPYYLTENFEGVFQNHIYTRIMDTNTPKNRSADIDKIEYLWRKRFHIDETPLEKFNYFISEYINWTNSPIHGEMKYYHKFSPEYTIITEDDDSTNGYEYYLFTQYDTTPLWHLVTLMYHQTAIEQFQGLSLDGGRCFVIVPDRKIFSYDKYHQNLIRYSFYIKKSLRYKLLMFFLNIEPPAEKYQYCEFEKAIIYFETEKEYVDFNNYLLENQNKYELLLKKYSNSKPCHYHQLENHGYIHDAFLDDYRNALVIKEMLSEFRMENSNEQN